MNFLRDLPWGKLIWLFLAFLFVTFMAWSVLYETLLPLYRTGDMPGFYRNVVGIPIIFIGVALFCYSAFLFLRDTFRNASSHEANRAESKLMRDQRSEPSRSKRNSAFRSLLRAWTPSGLLFIFSVGLIALGGYLTR